MLAACGCAPHQIELELTESAVMDQPDLAEATMRRIQHGMQKYVLGSKEPIFAPAAAHAALRAEIPFLDRDRAMDGEVATAVRLVESGKLLDAARVALSS